MINGLIAFGLASHTFSIQPWKLLYIIEGCATLTVGFIALFILPSKPQTTKILNEDERTFGESMSTFPPSLLASLVGIGRPSAPQQARKRRQTLFPRPGGTWRQLDSGQAPVADDSLYVVAIARKAGETGRDSPHIKWSHVWESFYDVRLLLREWSSGVNGSVSTLITCIPCRAV